MQHPALADVESIYQRNLARAAEGYASLARYRKIPDDPSEKSAFLNRRAMTAERARRCAEAAQAPLSKDRYQLLMTLDELFHSPFAPDLPASHDGQEVFRLASVADHYAHQGELARLIAASGPFFRKLALVSGDIGTGYLPIGQVHCLRLTHPNRLGTAFLSRMILDTKSIHTGTDVTMTDQIAARIYDPLSKPRRVLYFARPFHLLRNMATAKVQAPGLDLVMRCGTYHGVGPSRLAVEPDRARTGLVERANWYGDPVYMAWASSEMHRLRAFPQTVMMPIDVLLEDKRFAPGGIADLQNELQASFFQPLSIIPEDIARDAPAPPPAKGEKAVIAREPDNRTLTYPARFIRRYGGQMGVEQPAH